MQHKLTNKNVTRNKLVNTHLISVEILWRLQTNQLSNEFVSFVQVWYVKTSKWQSDVQWLRKPYISTKNISTKKYENINASPMNTESRYLSIKLIWYTELHIWSSSDTLQILDHQKVYKACMWSSMSQARDIHLIYSY